ncbi:MULTISPECIES: hypothetical protein [Streptomyces]|uniref:hypothetical protein n=1 Tax=Streptomyces TaxID=1883 RepID=UPI00102F62A7|nr:MULTISPECIES: hypothetical protein [Streptomyces]
MNDTSPNPPSAASRRRPQRALWLLTATLAAGALGAAGWFTVGPGSGPDGPDGSHNRIATLISTSAEPDPAYTLFEHLEAGVEIQQVGATHVFGNGARITVHDVREFEPEREGIAEHLEGRAVRASVRMEGTDTEGRPLGPPPTAVAAGHGLQLLQPVYDSEEDVLPAMSRSEGGMAFDVPHGVEFIVIEISMRDAGDTEHAHWRVDF